MTSTLESSHVVSRRVVLAGATAAGIAGVALTGAVAEFAPPLIVVLGHERCGAVVATIETLDHHTTPPGSIGALVDAIAPAVAPILDDPGDPVANGVQANVRHQVAQLRAGSAIVRDAEAAGTLAVVGARYDLDSAMVTLIRRADPALAVRA